MPVLTEAEAAAVPTDQYARPRHRQTINSLPDLDDLEAYLRDRANHPAMIEIGGQLACELLAVVSEARAWRASRAAKQAQQAAPPPPARSRGWQDECG